MAILRKGPFVDDNLNAIDVPTMGEGYPNAFTGFYPVTCADNGWFGEQWQGYFYKESYATSFSLGLEFYQQFDGLFTLGETVTTDKAVRRVPNDFAICLCNIAFRYQAAQDFSMRFTHSADSGFRFLTRIFVGTSFASSNTIYQSNAISGSHEFTVPAQVAPDNFVFAFTRADSQGTQPGGPDDIGPVSITLESI